MGHFRTRHIRAKYAKLKKKQLDLNKSKRQRDYKTKHWLVANAIVDIEMSDVSIQYKTPNNTKQFLTLSKGYYNTNSHQYFDATIKLIANFFFRKQTEFYCINILKSDNHNHVKKPNSFIVFTTSFNRLYNIVYSILSNTADYAISFTVLPKQQFDFQKKIKGFFVLIELKTHLNNFFSLPNLISDNIVLLNGEEESLVWLGLIYDNVFFSLKKIITFLLFFRKLSLSKFEQTILDDFSKQVKVNLDEISEIPLRKDLETAKELALQKSHRFYEKLDGIMIKKSQFVSDINKCNHAIFKLDEELRFCRIKQNRKELQFFFLLEQNVFMNAMFCRNFIQQFFL